MPPFSDVPSNFPEAAVIGRVSLSATGVLTIDHGGKYQFDGWIGAPGDEYTPHGRGRDVLGAALNTILRPIPGKPFPIYIVGIKPFASSGLVPHP